MHAAAEVFPKRGIVVSDLHLFARRSDAMARLESLGNELASAEVLVLNGDTFDFRWSTLRDHHATVAAAQEWLRSLVSAHPSCEVHFILGNHDCLAAFLETLPAMASTLPRFHWHEFMLRLGTTLFLHGDCTDAIIDVSALRLRRETWREDRQRGALAAVAYRAVDRLGITRCMHEWSFPREETVQRLVFHLDRACPGWRAGTSNCYFGHTHLPFSNYPYDGVAFHNTGSAIRGFEFNPIRFEALAETAVGSLPARS